MQKITFESKETLSLFKESKVKWEFEAVCLEIEKVLGGRDTLLDSEKKRIWSLPYNTWFTENKGWEALRRFEKVKPNKKTLNYLVGIIKNLK
jgi:hypothetical protein